MVHDHVISDKDVHFVIDPVTRAITTESSKLCLAQYDHNSEKFTFKVPRFIENHDMSECNTIAIDFENITRRKKEKNVGEYLAQEVIVEDDYVLFTWLVSQDATQLIGYLTFSVSFRCHDEDNNIIYEWGTDTFSRITVLEKPRYSQTIIEKHPDLIAQIRDEVKCLPAVTKENDGAFLRVVDGVWTVVTLSDAEGVSF